MPRRRGRPHVVAAAAVLAGSALLLTGCAGDATEAAPSDSATASPTPAPTARYDCDAVLPVERAATALGVSPDRLTGVDTARAAGSADILQRQARENGGLLSCGWEVQRSAVSLTVRVLQDAADLAAPVLAAGASTPTCEGALCRADATVDGTWLALEVLSPEATAEATGRLAAVLADDAARTEQEPVVEAESVPCGAVLPSEVLVATAGLVQPVAGVSAGAPTTISAAAAQRAGLASCTWSDAAAPSYAGVSIDVLPNGADGWRDLSLKTDLPLPLAPADAIGERALSGCSEVVCEVDTIQDGTWYRVTATGTAATARATTLAVLSAAGR